jgi:hypothetical protein
MREGRKRFEKRMFCDNVCRSEQLSIDGKGENNYFYGKKLTPWNKKNQRVWKHKTAKGYVVLNIRQNDGTVKKVYEHRFVMQENLGRELKCEEIVHHIDEDVANNAIENLILFESNAEHLRHHAELRRNRDRLLAS